MDLGIGVSEVTSPQNAVDNPATADTVETIDSGALLRGQSEVRISHGGAIYSLRQTRQGKLILTK